MSICKTQQGPFATLTCEPGLALVTNSYCQTSPSASSVSSMIRLILLLNFWPLLLYATPGSLRTAASEVSSEEL
ncbi:MAG: hypothetical protein JWM04_852, partial [Verrucomicrobiales bacterium]|nr:hypothetical protein [Verrucomicrobiales bacterium]